MNIPIKIHKNGEKLERFEKGVEIKNDGRKVRVVGSVMRIEVIPRTNGNDYKFDIILPNGKEMECSDEHSFIQWAEFMAGLVEAATGSKPKNGSERTIIEVNGVPMKFSDMETAKTMTIDKTVDPLEEVYDMPKKADTPTPATETKTTPPSCPTTSPTPTKSMLTNQNPTNDFVGGEFYGE